MYQLEFYSPQGHLLKSHIYPGGVCVIGRGRRADITLRHRSVSRQHAEIWCDDRGVCIRDLGSRQGLWLDELRIREHAPLATGDILRVGACRLCVANAATPGSILPESEVVTADDSLSSRGERVDGKVGDTTLAIEPEPEYVPSPLRSKSTISLCESFQEQIANTLNLYRRDVIHELSGERLKQEARRAAEQVLRADLIRVPTDIDREDLIEVVIAETVGLGPLEPLMADEQITEVMVNGPDRIYVERDGRLQLAPQRFTSAASLMSIIDRIVTPLGRRIDEGAPLVDARLPDGSRVNVIIPPLSLVGPVLTIRKFTRRKFGLEQLIAADALNTSMAGFLKMCVRFRKNIVVSGGTGTGKTTFLNALSEHIPERERIVTIEDSAEIQLDQEHVISLESRLANIEGSGEISIRELVRNSLRMRPDRIIVGECRGGEALDMLQAMNTGHDGSLTTAHANSPRDTLSRLEVMTLMAGMDLPVRAIREQIASAVDVLVQLTRFPDGCRRVTSITEVDGMEGDAVLTQELFSFMQTGLTPDGTVQGRFESSGTVPRFYQNLRSAGVSVNLSIFRRSGESL